MAALDKLGAVVQKKKKNLLPHDVFCEKMRQCKKLQKRLLIHFIHHLLTPDDEALQIILTGKTYLIMLIMDICNRFCNNDGHLNSFIATAFTGKVAVNIGGTTVHTALKIPVKNRINTLSFEVLAQYRTLMRYCKQFIIDEVSMVSAQLLHIVDKRLKDITGFYEKNFGGLDVTFVGDLRQLKPVMGTAIFLPIKQTLAAALHGPSLWSSLKFYPLTEFVRQSNVTFSAILTKIRDGLPLDEDELRVIESRFFSKEEANRLCPNGLRLFYSNKSKYQ